MRHHFHRCPNLRVVTAHAAEIHGRGVKSGGTAALDELCEAKKLAPCLGLVDCDVLTLAQKRTLLVTRATRLRDEDGGPSPIAGWPRERTALLYSLRRELQDERARIVERNRGLEREILLLDDVGRGEITDLEERAGAQTAIRVDASLEALSVKRLDAIDRALDAMEHGGYGTCAACNEPIEIERLRAVIDARLCAECARRQEPLRS